MWRRRGRIALVLLVGTTAALFLAWRLRTSERTEDDADGATRGDRARRAGRSGRVAGGNVLDWMEEPRIGRRRIAGSVVEDGKPAAGVVVELGSYRTFFLEEPPRRVVTDAAGRFDFGEQAPTTHTVVALAEGHAPALEVVRLGDPAPEPPADRLLLELRPCKRWVRGRVRDTSGNAIAGARVDAVGHLGTYLHQVRHYGVEAGQDGRFAFCAHTKNLVVSARGYESVRLGKDQPVGGWDVRLFSEATVEGVVVDGDEEPMPGVIVTLRGEAYASRRAPLALATRSKEDGTFRFQGVGPGAYSIAGDSPVSYSTLQTMIPNLHVAPGGRVTGLVLRMTRCDRSVSGRVIEEGRPVAGATIEIRREATTRADGSFDIACVPSGQPADVAVVAHDVIRPRTVPADTGSIDDLIVEVSRRTEIRGRVLSNGTPVSGAIVTVGDPASPVMMRPFFGESFRARSARDGSYSLRGLPRGEHEIAALDPATGRRSEPLELRVESNMVREGVDLQLARGGIIRGRVVDRDGAAAAGWKLRVDGGAPAALFEREGAVTDAEGRFEVVGLAKGIHQLEAARFFFGETEVDGRIEVELPHDDAVAEIELRLTKQASLAIAGRVIHEDGSAAPFARIRASSFDAAADERGRFVIHGVTEGRHRVEATAVEGSRGVTPDVVAGATDVVVVVAGVGDLEGRVEGAGARCIVTARAVPESDVAIPFLSPRVIDGSQTRQVVTDDGLFRIESLPHARYQVTAKGTAGVASGYVTVEPGRTAKVALLVGAPGRVEGVARKFPSGEPAAGITCTAGEDRAETDAAGAFILERVLPGGEVEVGCSTVTMPISTTTVFASGKTTISVQPGGTSVAEVFVVYDASAWDPRRKPGDIGAAFTPGSHRGEPALAFTDVVPGGPAEQAGVRDGDILVEIDGGAATGARVEVVEWYVATRSPGAAIGVRISRAGSIVSTTITNGARALSAP